jgi:flagellar biosynthetic protein FlhB
LSQDLAAAVTAAGGLLLLLLTARQLRVAFADMIGILPWHDCTRPWTAADCQQWVMTLGLTLARVLLIPLTGVFLFGIISVWGQIGVYLETGPMGQGLRMLDLVQGMKRVLPSKDNAVRLLLAIGKVSVVGTVLFLSVRRDLDGFVVLPILPLEDGIGWLFHRGLVMIAKLLVLLLVMALVDYLWRRYQHHQNLKMSLQELKDEWRNTSGDPQIKSRQRQRMRQFSMARMIAEVPRADVVVTNPMHVAVALRYARGSYAPRVVAKGLRKRAQRIKLIARCAGVPIVEEPALARALYRHVPLGECIPSQFFAAVAVILARLHRRGLRRLAL